MALNIFQNYTVMQQVVLADPPNGSLLVDIHFIPDTITLNTLAMFLQNDATGTRQLTHSVNFGLYSLNGATLSLANSASWSTVVTSSLGGFNWQTFAISATQTLSKGEWFFAVVHTRSLVGAANARWFEFPNIVAINDGSYGGPFFRGVYSVATSSLINSIATTDMIKEGSGTLYSGRPIILISE